MLALVKTDYENEHSHFHLHLFWEKSNWMPQRYKWNRFQKNTVRSLRFSSEQSSKGRHIRSVGLEPQKRSLGCRNDLVVQMHLKPT